MATRPVSDSLWSRSGIKCLLVVVDRLPSVGREFAPQPAVGPVRPRTPTPEPVPPRLGRRRPARPPTRPAGGGLPRRTPTQDVPTRDVTAQRVQDDVEQGHPTGLVEWRVAVAAFGRLHA